MTDTHSRIHGTAKKLVHLFGDDATDVARLIVQEVALIQTQSQVAENCGKDTEGVRELVDVGS